MRWLKRLALTVLGLFVALIAGGYLYGRAIGATVNTPVAAALAARFPAWFNEPKAEASVLAKRIQLVNGFAMTVFARNIPGARMLRVTRKGDLLVAVPDEGKVLLLERVPEKK